MHLKHLVYFVIIAAGAIAIIVMAPTLLSTPNSSVSTPSYSFCCLESSSLDGRVNETIAYSFFLSGAGHLCGNEEWHVTYPNGTNAHVLDGSSNRLCLDSTGLKELQYHDIFAVSHAGNYTLVLTFDGVQANKNFQIFNPIK